MKKKIFILCLFLFCIKMSAQCEQFGSIVISEIYFDTRYSESINTEYHHFGEYIELFNSTTIEIDLSGWMIRDNHTSFVIGQYPEHTNTIIPPGGKKIIIFKGFDYYNWWIGSEHIVSGAPSQIGAIGKFKELFPPTNNQVYNEEDILVQGQMVLYNLTDKVSLYNPLGRLIDEVSYYNGQNSQVAMNSAKNFMGISDFTIEINTQNTPDNMGFLTNFEGGVFNGPIGGFPVLDGNGNPILDQDENPIYYQTGLYRKSIYLSNVDGYYFEGNKNIQITNATPLEVPLSIPLKNPHFDLFSPPNYSGLFNYTHNINYDVSTGEKVTESRTYYDDLAKPLVSLSHDFMTDKTWGTENRYDSFGRPFQSSFPALICGFNFNKKDFLSNPSVYQNFLAKYYSDQNTEHPYQSTATHPYTEVEYDKLNPGNVIKQFGGNQINGEWKTGFSYTMPAAQEMHYVYGYDYFDSPITSNKKEIITQFYKTITVDAHGVENVVFTDSEGKVLATARSGTGITNYPVVSLIGTQGHIDVHIPSGTTHAVTFLGVGGRSLYDVWDLKTGLLIDPSVVLSGGNFYRIVAKVTPTSDPKVYVNMLTNGAITYSTGALGVSYRVNYHDYTINVYNKTGQLTRVVQPQGFKNALVSNSLQTGATRDYMNPLATSFVSDFQYNTLGQLIQTTSPDEGTSRFVNRKDGQIRYSQNALQIVSNQVSYTNYDSYGRPVESGVIQGDGAIWNSATSDPDGNLIAGSKSEQSFVVYDYPGNHNFGVIQTLASTGLNPANYNQENLSGNVVMTFNENSATWYSYDIYGRMKWMVQSLTGLPVKTIHYTYNARGDIKQVIYQKDVSNEKFVHQYTYNFNGALEKVETSTTGITFTTQAEYEYYIDGTLKRKNINNGLQGLDYVYTLGGMLKSINHPSLLATKDPGGDSNDAFGFILDYYTGDYNRASQPHINTSENVLPSYNTDMYDGNIKAIRWAHNNHLDINSSHPSVSSTTPKAYVYKYNRNGWITEANYGSINPGTSNTLQNITRSNAYNEKAITYDSNGNIKTLKRYNQNGGLYDNFIYNYDYNNNQLSSVSDAPTVSVDYDIDSQPANNYLYNFRGQLIQNTQENLTYSYNTEGLVTQVARNGNAIVRFYYNERGIRVKKESFLTSSPYTIQFTEYYLTDVSGNVISLYRQEDGQPIAQKELPIYGESRLGIFMKQGSVTNYEITDHLGNVRSIIQRQNNNPIIVYYSDYHPFGEPLPLRNVQGYRYAFQGQELDTETGMEAFKLRLWDGRIGRWLNPDPYGQYHSTYLGMGNNPINGVDVDGGLFALGAVIGGVVGGAISIGSQYIANGKVNWTTVAVDTASGALIGSGAGLLATAVGGAIVASGGSLIDSGINKGFNNLTTNDLVNAGYSGVIAGVSGKLGGKFLSSNNYLAHNINKFSRNVVDRAHNFYSTKILKTHWSQYTRPTKFMNDKFSSYLNEGQVGFVFATAEKKLDLYNKFISPNMPNKNLFSNNFTTENQMNWFLNNPFFFRGRGWTVEVGELKMGQWEE